MCYDRFRILVASSVGGFALKIGVFALSLVAFVVSASAAEAQFAYPSYWPGADPRAQGLCPGGHWVHSPSPDGSMDGATCVPNQQSVPAPVPVPQQRQTCYQAIGAEMRHGYDESAHRPAYNRVTHKWEVRRGLSFRTSDGLYVWYPLPVYDGDVYVYVSNLGYVLVWSARYNSRYTNGFYKRLSSSDRKVRNGALADLADLAVRECIVERSYE